MSLLKSSDYAGVNPHSVTNISTILICGSDGLSVTIQKKMGTRLDARCSPVESKR